MQGFITHVRSLAFKKKSRKCFECFEFLCLQIESCSEFWFQPKQRSEEVNEFERSCVNRAIKKITIDQNLFVGKIVIVGENISGDEKYHRGKILRIKYDSYLVNIILIKSRNNNGFSSLLRILLKIKKQINKSIILYLFNLFFFTQVKLIDIGRTISCGLNKLFEYCGTLKRFMSLPPRCFVCRLAQMQPTQFYSPNGLWSSDLNKLFKEKTYNREIKIDVRYPSLFYSFNAVNFI